MQLSYGEFCIPREGLTSSVFMRVTMTFLYEHPEQLHKSALSIVNDAFCSGVSVPCEQVANHPKLARPASSVRRVRTFCVRLFA